MNYKFRTLWLGLIPLLMIYLVLTKVDMRIDITDFFFAGTNADAAFLVNQLNADSLQRQYILSIRHLDQSAATISKFLGQYETQLAQLESVQGVWSSSFDAHQIEQLLDLYSNYNVGLYSLHPQTRIPELYESTHLQQRAEKIKLALLGFNAPMIKPMIQKDPMLLTLDWAERIKGSVSRSIQPEQYSVLFLDAKAAGTDLIALNELRQHIEDVFQQLNKHYDDVFKLELTGVPIFASKIKSDISRDIQWVSTLSIVLMAVLFIIVFHSLKSLFFVALMLSTTVGGAVLITQLVFGFVHGLTLAMGITLIGICIDYFIHALVHGSAGGSINYREKVFRIWPSLLLGGITTVVGYLALGMSGFPGLQQIALFSASGIIIALLITRYIIPSLMAEYNLHLRPALGSHHLLTIFRSTKAKLGLLCFVLTVFIVGIFQVQWSNSLQTLTPDLEQLKLNDERIRSRMTNVVPGRFVLTQAASSESALQLSEQVQVILEDLRNQGSIDEFFGVFPWIASQQLQQRNIQGWNHELETQGTKQWELALTSAGLSTSVYPPLLKLSDDYLSLDDLQNTPVWPLLSKQILVDDENTTVVTWLGRHDPALVNQALVPVSGARYFSQKESLDQLATAYRLKAQYLLVFGLLAIAVLLSIRFRSVPVALKVLTPALLAILFVFGITGILGKPMTILHLIGLLLAAAVCVDYGIFYFENRSNNQPLTFQAITASALTSSVSFGCLAVAENPALQALAWTVSPGIIIGFILCPVILQLPRQIQE